MYTLVWSMSTILAEKENFTVLSGKKLSTIMLQVPKVYSFVLKLYRCGKIIEFVGKPVFIQFQVQILYFFE